MPYIHHLHHPSVVGVVVHRPCWVGVAVDSLPERTGAHRMADLGMIAAAAEGNNPPVLVADLGEEDNILTAAVLGNSLCST